MQVLCVGVALALIAVPNLHDELAVLRELQKLVVGDWFEIRQPIGGAVVPADPNKALVVYVDPMLPLWPLITLSVSTPRLDILPRRIEDNHRRRSDGCLFRLEGSRPV